MAFLASTVYTLNVAIFICSLILTTYAAPSPGNIAAGLQEDASPLSSQFHAQDVLGQYSYGYASVDGSHKTESRAADGTITGSYGYVGADGKVININYIANELGFQAISDDGSIVPNAISDPSDYEEEPEPEPIPLPQPAPAPVALPPLPPPAPAPIAVAPPPPPPPPPRTISFVAPSQVHTAAIVAHVPAPPPTPVAAPAPAPVKQIFHHAPSPIRAQAPAVPTPIFGYATYEYAVPAPPPAPAAAPVQLAPQFQHAAVAPPIPVAKRVKTKAVHSTGFAPSPVFYATPSLGVNGLQYSRVIGGYKIHV
uniref:Cuticle protein 6 n=1 Tax=Strigamia maritima TaxID=126957 RepID=T1JPE4_STRMM